MTGKIDIYTDGSYSPHTHKGGFAFKIIGSDEVYMSWGAVENKECTDILNIEALAITNAMSFLFSNAVLSEIGDITVYTDSKTISDFLNDGVYPDASDFVIEKLKRISGILCMVPGKCFHVKAHTSSKDVKSIQNQWCDTYANAARLTGGQYFLKKKLVRGTEQHPILSVSIGYMYEKYNYAIEIKTPDRTVRASGFFHNEGIKSPTDAFYASILNAHALSKRVRMPFKDVMLCIVGDTMEQAYYDAGQETDESPFKKRYNAIMKGKELFCYPKDEGLDLSFNYEDLSFVANSVKSMNENQKPAIIVRYQNTEEFI